ncbi:hypothetical protein [Streptomyces lunaelactis]|uniref:hypothetical protein n=1 Tax=Streptomyces lunaelactis TaxID=1535768 RepID=UPI0028164B8F|nr:hypothetical protein [Streptomyces lunaelactis]
MASPLPISNGSSPTYQELMNQPGVSYEEQQRLKADSLLGNIAALLVSRGNVDVARLILLVQNCSIEYDGRNENDLWLEVHPGDREGFTEDVVELLRGICREVADRLSYDVQWLGVRETLLEVSPDWRDQLREVAEGKRQTNQARRIRAAEQRWVEDKLSFTNPGELRVYQALKHIQEKILPPEETIGIFPLSNGRISGRTWEPDVLVTYKGRAGVLEIDGPHHNARKALDTTRDHLLRDAGVAYVDRIPVEALEDSKELLAALQRFLRRLTETR